MTAKHTLAAVAAAATFGVLALPALPAAPVAGAAGSATTPSSAGSASSATTAQSAPPGRTALAPAPALPRGTSVEGPLPGSTTVSADVVLALPDPESVAAFVAAVSTPGSGSFRQYLSPGQFATRFGPGAGTVDAVRRWLAGQGLAVGAVSADGLLLPVQGSAAAVSAAFGTTLSSVRLPSGRSAYTDTTAPSVPSELAGAVRGVVGLNTVAQWRSALRPAAVGVSAAAATTSGAATTSRAATTFTTAPAVRPQGGAQQVAPQACAAGSRLAAPGGALTFTELASVYDMSGLYGQGRTGAGVTVALYELEPYSATDIDTFTACYGLGTTVATVTVDGGPGTGPGSGEAALDIEDVAALAPTAAIVVYQGPNSSKSGAGSGPLETLDRIAADDRAQVVSSSWGICEASLTATAATLESDIFQVMAAQGQTMLVASGDSGSEGCYPTGGAVADGLAVDDPAGQPGVTAVGGTGLFTGTAAGQVVWNDCQGRGVGCATIRKGASGGGISAEWAMPTWQSAAGQVNAATCRGSVGCREVPDVAADAAPATGYVVYYSRNWITVGGTSASAPLWAALMALTDQGCNGTVGMANPALYTLGAAGSGAFTDVTAAGDNDFTNTNGGLYPTAAGYDMATGWGSPVGTTLLADLQTIGGGPGCPAVTGLSSGHGPTGGGGTLTITGTDLAGATAVGFGPSLHGTVLSSSAGQVTVAVPAAPWAETVPVTVTTPGGTSAAVSVARYTFGTPRNGLGYWLAAADGGLFAFGDAGFHGSMGGQPLNEPVVGLAATGDDQGYWEVASDGGLFAFGDAQFYGSMGGKPLNQPIVGLAATPDGKGYWEVAADGGLFAFGDAQFYGSMGGKPLNQPIVGLAATYTGGGYWEVASDGGLFSFGNAQFYGSMGGVRLNRPVVAMTATPDGGGYWEVASDGGIFSFGDARFYGSTGSLALVAPIVGMADT